MTAKQLTDSILQMAIEGKLVPQEPNDEPASVLLEHIREEKRRLVKEGKLKKKELEEKPVGEDEIPFDIPENWEWCRLSYLGYMERGNGIKRNETEEHGLPCIRYGEIYTSYLYKFSKTKSFVSPTLYEKCKHIQKGDVVFTLTGENNIDIAKALAYRGEQDVAAGGDLAIWKKHGCYADFLSYMMYAPYMISQKTIGSSGNIIVHTSTSKVGDFLFPLPPLAEQHRIVEKIEQTLPIVKEYGEAYEEASKMDAELPDKLKKSILQEAIMGKLGTQDPNDEPASKLLEQIREEKKKLVRDGVLKKKDLIETPVEEDEVPFNIPESWCFLHLGEVTYNHGQKKPDSDFTYIDIGSIDNKHQKLNDNENVLKSQDAPSRARKIVKIDDILYATVRPYLHNMCIIDREFSKEPIASTGFAVLACINGLYNKFLFNYLLSPIFDMYANDGDNAKGMAYPAINDKTLYNGVVPLPPLAEQRRIVRKIEELFAEIDNMTIKNTNINEVKETESKE